MAADHAHDLFVLQVYHCCVIDLAFPDGEFVQTQDTGRSRLIWGFQKSPGLLGDTTAYQSLPHTFPQSHMAHRLMYRILSQMMAKTLAVASPGTTDRIGFGEHLAAALTAEAPLMQREEYWFVPQPSIPLILYTGAVHLECPLSTSWTEDTPSSILHIYPDLFFRLLLSYHPHFRQTQGNNDTIVWHSLHLLIL
jgi:hypothetical protein